MKLQMAFIRIDGELHVLGRYAALRILSQASLQPEPTFWEKYFPTFAPLLKPIVTNSRL